MFKRSRRKIILSIMLPLVLLFVISLSVILGASYHELQNDHSDMLDQYLQTYSLETNASPNSQPDSMGNGNALQGPDMQGIGMGNNNDPAARGNGRQTGKSRDFELSTFYSVALADDGTVLAVDDGDKTFYSEDELTALAQDVLAGGKNSGKDGDLTYQVVRKDGYTLVAFMDNTVSDNNWDSLLRNFLIVGGTAIVVIFFFSLWLSNRIIRPLEENDRKQKQFISDASHELKTPVAAISANAELLSRELGQNDWLDNIRYENERMGGLVKQLLNLSRAENMETPMEAADFSRLVTGETLALESLAFDQDRTILSDIEDGVTVNGNPQQLTQLVSILLDNAIHYSTGPEISLSLKHQGRSAVLTVSNDGDAIPPDKLAHLFDRFYRADESRTGEEPHYGLGLSIAKAIAEKHGGTIRADCPDGKVCFTVTIPQKN